MAAPRAVRVLLTALFGALTVLTGPDKRKVTAPGVRDNALHPHLGSQGQATAVVRLFKEGFVTERRDPHRLNR